MNTRQYTLGKITVSLSTHENSPSLIIRFSGNDPRISCEEVVERITGHLDMIGIPNNSWRYSDGTQKPEEGATYYIGKQITGKQVSASAPAPVELLTTMDVAQMMQNAGEELEILADEIAMRSVRKAPDPGKARSWSPKDLMALRTAVHDRLQTWHDEGKVLLVHTDRAHHGVASPLSEAMEDNARLIVDFVTSHYSPGQHLPMTGENSLGAALRNPLLLIEEIRMKPPEELPYLQGEMASAIRTVLEKPQAISR